MLRPAKGKEVKPVDAILNFFVAVAASVIGTYISKWLDRHDRDR